MDTKPASKNSTSDATVLRQKAEELMKKKLLKTSSKLSEADTLKLIHELQAHQIELELQNEELCQTVEDVTKRKQVEEALIKSEEKYRIVADFTYDWEYWISPEGSILYISPSCQRITGYNPEEFKVNPELLTSIIHPDDRQTITEHLRVPMDSENVCNHEFRIVSLNNNEHWIDHICQPVFDANGHFLGRRASNRDITERRRTNEALHESEARYHLLFEASADGILIADIETKTFKYANPAVCQMLGYVEEELRTMGLADIHPRQDLQHVIAEFESQARGEKILASDIPCLKKDGSIIYVDINTTVTTMDGRLYTVGLFRDITERKRMEEKLRLTEHQFRLVWEKAADGMRLINEQGIVLMVNEAYCRFVQKEQSELQGKSLAVIYEKGQQDDVVRKHQERFKSHTVEAHYERELILWNGRKVWVEVTNSFLELEGQPPMLLGIFRDITERKRAEELLHQSEIKLQVIIESTADGILAINGNGKVIKTNNRFAELWKIPPAVLHSGDDATLLNFVLEQLISPKQFLDKVQQLYNSTDEDTDTLFFKDGRIFERYSAPLLLDDKIMGRVWSFRDITVRRRAEEALRESKNIIQNIIDNSPSLIYILDLDGKFILANKKLAEVLNFSAEKLLGNTRQLFMAKEFADQHRNNDLQIITSENAAIYEEKILESDGQHIYLTQKFPLFDLEGKIYAVGGISTDITERKQAEEALWYERTLLRQLIDNVPDLMYTKDTACRKTLVNSAEVQNMGVKSESEVIGKDDFAFYSKEMAEKFFADDQSVIQTGQPLINKEEYTLNESGQEKMLLTSKFPLRDHSGQIIGLVGIGRDITERKLAEEKILFKNQQLLKLNAEKDKFFSIISHDLRSPFNSFLGLTQIMADDLPDLTMDEIQKFSVSMRNSAILLSRLLENLLQWSRLQQGSIPFDPELVPLRPIVDDSIALALEPAKNKGIEITSDMPGNLRVFADCNILQTVIRNLVSNAVKFTHKGGKVNISARTTRGQNVEIAVKDTGIGMTGEMINNLFRLDVKTSRKGTEGEPSTGLGLILCKEFVEKLGGKIWAKSEEGKGSTFYFTISRSEVHRSEVDRYNQDSADL